jgi:hypothetical protein
VTEETTYDADAEQTLRSQKIVVRPVRRGQRDFAPPKKEGWKNHPTKLPRIALAALLAPTSKSARGSPSEGALRKEAAH